MIRHSKMFDMQTMEFLGRSIEQAEAVAGRSKTSVTAMFRRSGFGVLVAPNMDDAQRSQERFKMTNGSKMTPLCYLGIVRLPSRMCVRLEELHFALKRLQRNQGVIYEPELQPWLVWQPSGSFFHFFDDAARQHLQSQIQNSRLGHIDFNESDEEEEEEEEEEVNQMNSNHWGSGKTSTRGKVGTPSPNVLSGGSRGVGSGKVGRRVENDDEQDEEDDEDEDNSENDSAVMYGGRGGGGKLRSSGKVSNVSGPNGGGGKVSGSRQSSVGRGKIAADSHAAANAAANAVADVSPSRGGKMNSHTTKTQVTTVNSATTLHQPSSHSLVTSGLSEKVISSHFYPSKNIRRVSVANRRGNLTLAITADGVIYIKGCRTAEDLQLAFSEVFPFIWRFKIPNPDPLPAAPAAASRAAISTAPPQPPLPSQTQTVIPIAPAASSAMAPSAFNPYPLASASSSHANIGSLGTINGYGSTPSVTTSSQLGGSSIPPTSVGQSSSGQSGGTLGTAVSMLGHAQASSGSVLGGGNRQPTGSTVLGGSRPPLSHYGGTANPYGR